MDGNYYKYIDKLKLKITKQEYINTTWEPSLIIKKLKKVYIHTKVIIIIF